MYETANKAALLVRLFTVCEQEIEKAQSTRLWIEQFDCQKVSLPILEIAKYILNDYELDQTQAFAAICDAKALKRLLKMPNRFWFWTLLKEAILHQGHFDAPIKLQAVRSALEAKRTYLRYQTRRLELKRLSNTEACRLMDKGLILLTGEDADATIVKNPILSRQ